MAYFKSKFTLKHLAIYFLIFIGSLSNNIYCQGLSLDWVVSCPTYSGTNPNSIVLDQDENSYITGWFDSITDFDPGLGTYNLVSEGMPDIFIQKVDSSGNLVWAHSFGSNMGENRWDEGKSITVDSQGNVYVTGTFRDTIDFDPGPGIYNLYVPDPDHWGTFILKLDSNGNFIWATSIDNGAGRCIETDSSDNVYITGEFGGGTIDFDPGPGVYNLTSATINEDVFVLKLSSQMDFIWAKGYGSGGDDIGFDIHLDNFNNVLVTGYFNGIVDFDPGPGVYNLIANWNEDVFIQKLDSGGNFIWARSFGGSGYDWGYDLETDDSGNIYTTGRFQWVVDFDPGPAVYNLSSPFGNFDFYVVKLNANGDFVWANSTGGDNNDTATDIEIDNFGDIYVSGRFLNDVDFDPGSGVYILHALPQLNGGTFLQKLDSAGNFIWANGGDMGTIGGHFEITSDGTIYSTDRYWVTSDFDPELSVFNIPSVPGMHEHFIQKLKQCINPILYDTLIGCESVTSPISGISWYSSGTYYDTIQVSGLCDKFVSVDVTILNNDSSFLDASACYFYVPPSGMGIYTASGIYTDVLIGGNFNGCDSTIIISLSINKSDTTYDEIVCDSLISPSGSYIWTSGGTYTDTIMNFLGCDSILTINLSVLGNSLITQNAISCESYLSPSGDYLWTSSGVYQDTLLSSFGCDSVFYIDLTLFSNTNSVINVTSCNSYISPSGNYTYSSSGSYIDTIFDSNSNGCDSIININLTINNDSYTVINPVVCDSYLSPSGNYLFTNSGNYKDTLAGANLNGCDSIIDINLTINTVNNLVTNISLTLTSNSILGDYQWIDCESSTIVLGETNQSFSPSEDGSFAVVVTENGCQDTSKCEDIIHEITVTIPNTITPNDDGFNDSWIIQNIERFPDHTIEIFNRNGSLVFETVNYQNDWSGEYNGSNLPATTYYYIIDLGVGKEIVKGDLTIVREE
tara:strand:- start:1902 stop:4799 length:2898 start_codon:yes stop_codon:yes gene_type:complete